MSAKRFKIAIFSILFACSLSCVAAPLFVDSGDDDNDDDEEQSVIVCTDCAEDSLGRVEGSDGSKWNNGADDHWRSDSGEDCYFSKSLEKYICK